LNFNRLAHILSSILHPLLLPTLAFGVLLYISPIAVLSVNFETKWRLLLVIFLLTFVAPVLGVLVFYLTGGVESLTMKAKEDRHLPFMMTTLFYLGITTLFTVGKGFRELPVLSVIIGSITFSIGLVTIITFYWKISAHSVGISGVVGFLLGLSIKFGEENLLYPLIITVLLAGLLMSARMYLNAHTPAQIIAGSALGFFNSILAVLFFL